MSLRKLLTLLILLCVGPLILLTIFLTISNVLNKRAERNVDAARRFDIKSVASRWSVLLDIPRNAYREPLIQKPPCYGDPAHRQEVHPWAV